MKLPSGREISISSLADVAEMLATESFHLENIDEAEEEVTDNLRSEFFSLSGTEKPFDSDDDIAAIMAVVKPIAEEVGCGLSAKMDEYRPRIEAMIAMIQRKTAVSAEAKHKLLVYLNALSAVLSNLSRLYDEHPELNDGVDISSIIPMPLDDWDVELSAKINEIEGTK